jgi:uroporphyrin-III C-methyltransferase
VAGGFRLTPMDALVLIGHGSPLAGANRDMLRVAAALTRRDRPVSTCTVDRAEPDLPGLVAAHAAAGARRVVVVPWLLQLGRHLVEDIPRAVAAARTAAPGVQVVQADPLGFDELLVQLVERRIAGALDAAPAVGPPVVHLVGAGPGDPGMVTVRARELVATCDCLIHDRLVPPELLALAPSTAVLHPVGKHGWGEAVAQAAINELLVACAGRHRRVVRLKGGDPLVFGRAGEEIDALAATGIAVEIVPGVTSGLGAAAALGLPLTRRGTASSLAFATGRCHDDGAGPDWRAIAQVDTVILYMAARNLAAHCAALVAAGRSGGTPACAVQWATRPEQRTVVGTLADLAKQVAAAGLGSPLLVIVGAAAGNRTCPPP